MRTEGDRSEGHFPKISPLLDQWTVPDYGYDRAVRRSIGAPSFFSPHLLRWRFWRFCIVWHVSVDPSHRPTLADFLCPCHSTWQFKKKKKKVCKFAGHTHVSSRKIYSHCPKKRCQIATIYLQSGALSWIILIRSWKIFYPLWPQSFSLWTELLFMKDFIVLKT